jgi:hypothetical protein
MTSKGWHQRKHKRTSTKGKSFSAGKADRRMLDIDLIFKNKGHKDLERKIEDFSEKWAKKDVIIKVAEYYGPNGNPTFNVYGTDKSLREFASKMGNAIDVDEFSEAIPQQKYIISKKSKDLFDKFNDICSLTLSTADSDIPESSEELAEQFATDNSTEAKNRLNAIENAIEDWDYYMRTDSHDLSGSELITLGKEVDMGYKVHDKLVASLKKDLKIK